MAAFRLGGEMASGSVLFIPESPYSLWFSDLLKPTFGPKGLDKMLYKSNGTTAVTNDGAKIVAELLVKHPAAKMMVSMANSQEENCGDGVTTTMLLCGSLLQEGNNLLKKGLHPLT